MRDITKCRFFNTHKYEIHKEVPLKDQKGTDIGIIIISKCTFCGRIRHDQISVDDYYGRR